MGKQRASRIFLGILAATLIFGVVDVAPAVAASKSKKPKKSEVFYYYEDKPFDTSLSTLKPNFLGHNYLYVYKKYREHKLEYYFKDEFETSEQFDKRITEFANSTLVGNTRLSSLLSFVNAYQPDVSYNADTGTITVKPLTRALDLLRFSEETGTILDRVGITLKTDSPKYTYYTGTNAFGVKRKIRRASYFSVDLAVNHYVETSFNFQLPPEKAREAKKEGYIVSIGYMEVPFVGNSQNEKYATIDNPFEESDLILCFPFKIKELWYVNKRSGEIYHKFIPPALDDSNAHSAM